MTAIGINGIPNNGVSIKIVTIVIRILNSCRSSSLNEVGSVASRVPMSVLNLLMSLPIGVDSKKFILPFSTEINMKS